MHIDGDFSSFSLSLARVLSTVNLLRAFEISQLGGSLALYLIYEFFLLLFTTPKLDFCLQLFIKNISQQPSSDNNDD